MNYYIPNKDEVVSDKIAGQVINRKLDLDLRYAVDAFTKYFNTLTKVGYISKYEMNVALVYIFMVNYYIKSDMFNLDDCYKRSMFKIFNCLYDKSCIFKE